MLRRGGGAPPPSASLLSRSADGYGSWSSGGRGGLLSASAAEDEDKAGTLHHSRPTSPPAPSAAAASRQAYLARTTCVGTACFMAPEVVLGADEGDGGGGGGAEGGHGPPADVWSLGMTVLELATGCVPLAGASLVEVALTVAHRRPPTLADHCAATGTPAPSPAAVDFVAACLARDPGQRPTADKLLGHRFLRAARPDAYVAARLVAAVSAAASAPPSPLSPSPAPSPRFGRLPRTASGMALRSGGSGQGGTSAGGAPLHATAAAPKDRPYHTLTWTIPADVAAKAGSSSSSGSGSSSSSSRGGDSTGSGASCATPSPSPAAAAAPHTLTFETSAWFGKARVLLDGGTVLLTKRYGLLAQLSWSADTFQAAVPDDAPAWGGLAGAPVSLAISAGLDFDLHGTAAVGSRCLGPGQYALVRRGGGGGGGGGGSVPAEPPADAPPPPAGPAAAAALPSPRRAASAGADAVWPPDLSPAASAHPHPAPPPPLGAVAEERTSLPPPPPPPPLPAAASPKTSLGRRLSPTGVVEAAGPDGTLDSTRAPPPPPLPRSSSAGTASTAAADRRSSLDDLADAVRAASLRRAVSVAFSGSGWDEPPGPPPRAAAATPPPPPAPAVAGAAVAAVEEAGEQGRASPAAAWRAHVEALVDSLRSKEAAWAAERAGLASASAAAQAAASARAASAEAEVAALRGQVERLTSQVRLLERIAGEAAHASALL